MGEWGYEELVDYGQIYYGCGGMTTLPRGQGDAKFASLIERMGGKISQDEERTTVQGPARGKRLKVIHVIIIYSQQQ